MRFFEPPLLVDVPVSVDDATVQPPAVRVRSRLRSVARVSYALLKLALLLVIIYIHITARISVDRVIPLAARPFYPMSFSASLSIASGRGFVTWKVPDTDGLKALNDFLAARRDALSPDDLELAAQAGAFQEVDVNPDALVQNRRLDIWTAGMVWRFFGVSWRAYFAFCAVLSAVACVLLGLIARRLSGNDWCGLLACLFMTLSPLEATYVSYAPYTMNPTWFICVAFFGLICVGESFSSRRANLASWVVAGLLCILGRGWRPDVMLVVPYALCIIVGRLLVLRRSWRDVGLSCLLFLLGVWVGKTAIAHVGPSYEVPLGAATHIAIYADAVREEILHLEDTFAIPRDDSTTELHVKNLNSTLHPDQPIYSMGPGYGPACETHFKAQILYNLYSWVRHYPRFFWTRTMSYVMETCSPDRVVTEWSPRVRELYPRAVRAFDTCAPWLLLIGLLFATILGPEPVSSAGLGLFAVYYGVVFFLVLPEEKHMGPFLIPYCVFWAIALVAPLQALLMPRQMFAGRGLQIRRRLVVLIAGLVVVTLLWQGLVAFSWWFSARTRSQYIKEILALATSGAPAPQTVVDDRIFKMPTERGASGVGYLLEISAGAAPGGLGCHTELKVHGLDHPSYTYHELYPNRRQYFFVTDLNPDIARGLEYYCSADVDGDARIVSCTRVDLSHWEHPMMQMLFYEGQSTAGAREVNYPFASIQLEAKGTYSPLGIPFVDLLFMGDKTWTRYLEPVGIDTRPGAETATVDTSAWKSSGGSIQQVKDGLEITTLAGQYAYGAAIYDQTAPAAGTYTFSLRCRLIEGRVSLGVLTADGSRWLAQAEYLGQTGEWSEISVSAPLEKGQGYILQLANSNPEGNFQSRCVVGDCRVTRREVGAGAATTLVRPVDSPSASRLPITGWQYQVGVKSHEVAGGIEVESQPLFLGGGGIYPRIEVEKGGRYVFGLRIHPIDGIPGLYVIDGPYQKLLSAGVVWHSAPNGDAWLLVDVDLASHEVINLFIENDTRTRQSAHFVLEELLVGRVREPLVGPSDRP